MTDDRPIVFLVDDDLSVRRAQDNWEDAAVLPPYKRLVLDEAHHLEEVAASHLGVQVTSRMVRRLLARFEMRGELEPILQQVQQHHRHRRGGRACR